jgi:hypothetical protein
MFVREKRIGRYTYVYLIETVREDGRIKQRIIRNLGRKEDVDRRGDLDRLARSAARLAQRSMILSLIDEGSVPALACQRIGPPLLFERLWRDTGCREVLHELLADRGFEFPVERAVFHPASVDGLRLRPRLRATTIASTVSTACNSIISTAPWPGSARDSLVCVFHPASPAGTLTQPRPRTVRLTARSSHAA